MAGIGGLIGGIGGMVQGMYSAEADRIQAEGDWKAAASYGYAAGLEDVNINTEKLSVGIQNTQLARKISKVEGTAAATEGAGNVSGGSAGDIFRENVQQGALAHSVINVQGAVQENAYKAQKTAFQAQQIAAETASNVASKMAQGAEIGGMFSLLGGIAGMMG